MCKSLVGTIEILNAMIEDLAHDRDAWLEEAAKVAESEPEPDEHDVPPGMTTGETQFAIAATRVTKRNIAERTRALKALQPSGPIVTRSKARAEEIRAVLFPATGNNRRSVERLATQKLIDYLDRALSLIHI